MKTYTIGGMDVIVTPSAVIGALGLWIFLSGLGAAVLGFSTVAAIIGGLVAMLVHFASSVIHQWGHSLAARRVGHPMTGVRMQGVRGVSVYPHDEPELPAGVHIRRALGGPVVSLAVSVILGIVVLLLRSAEGDLVWWLAVFALLDNLLIFTLVAFLPLGFTDGSTLLRYWGK